MMDALALLAHFRSLGGVADNVSLRQGPHGLGLFALDPRQPVRVSAPASLLIAPTALQVMADGQVRVRTGTGLSTERVSFHERYQRSVAWGAGGLESIRRYHQQMGALPDTLKCHLLLLGGSDDIGRQPTPADAFQAHCVSRQISVGGVSMLMPVLELINHRADGAPYVVDQGVSVSGTFEDEVFARYRRHLDAFHFFFNYHVACPARSALSCAVSIAIPRFGTLRISRLDGLAEMRQGLRVPRLSAREGEIHLPFLELANLDEPGVPRQVFVGLMAEQGLAADRADSLFDGLMAHNRQVLDEFLQACEGVAGEIVPTLQAVARHQLSCLSQARTVL